MNHSLLPRQYLSRTLIACLIISLMILSPLAPLAQGAPNLARVRTTSAMEPPAPFAPTITATKTDSFADVDGDGKAAPGETITYDVNISNTGPDDATGVNFMDTIDANTTLVGGSLKVSPLAFPDVFAAAENTPLVVGAPGVLTNDTGLPAPTAVPIAGGATAQGGTVTLNADGSFTYNPPADFEGNDSFTYTATNGLTPNDTALVTLNVDAPPSVASTTPTNGATEVAQNTDITITFSEAVNVTGNWFQIVCDESGTRDVDDTDVTGGPTTFTINPDSDFSPTETCTVTVFAAQVSDQDVIDPPDLMAANFVFSFTTTEQELAPTVTATTPTNGAVDQPTNTNITVTFSESVNLTGNWFQIVCTTSGTKNPADTAVTPPSPATSFTINPNADFAAGETCTVTIIAAQVTDVDTNDPPDNMAANFVFSFSTDAAPAVTATTPTNGATQVANNTNISITFNESVDVTGNWFQIVGATSGTKNVADTVVTGGPTTFDINPADFANGELVTVTVFAAQVADQDTNDPPQNMAANFVFSFTIDQAPSVTATTPTNGATGVAINSNLSITFSEAVNVTGNWFTLACATSGTRNVGDTVVGGGPTTFTINPNADFANGEVCTVTVVAAQVTDQDSGDPPDNMEANFVFSFTTVDIAPTVTATTPTNGATNQATNTDITVTFSEPVNVTGNWFTIVCTSSGTRNVADTVVTPPSPATSFTINPNTDFTGGETCTVTIVAAQVTDADTVDPPDNMAANFVFSFTMDAAPTVTATVPTNGATQVANNTNISITFSEPVNVTGNWFQIVGATSGTRNVADTVVTGGPTTFTINPNTDFTNGELVTVTVFAAQVEDQDANDPPQNMAANFVFSFTIDMPPTVTTTVPTNGAIDVLKGSNIVINFSENVTATTSSFTIECPSPGNLQAFAVSGSGTNQITLNPNADLPQGTICTVTVIANQISDTDAGDPPDNMDANFVFSFGVKPEAVDDARNATGNIRIQTAGNSNFSVLTNDISGLPITVTLSDTTSLRGGNVAVAANGTFSYNPPAGYEGPDSFNYTISNAAGSDVGTVNITIAGMIWFIDDNPASGACTTNNNICGRLTNPFSTLASFEAVNGNATPLNGADVIAPEAGDHIFIFSGSYTAPLTLENNQRVIGQGAPASLATLTGITPATDSDALPSTGGAAPTITSAGNGFNVVSNNQLHGLAFSNTTGTAINSNANVGTLVIGTVTINNSGSNGAGIVLDDGGTSVTTSGTNSINTRSGVGLSLTNNTTIGGAGLTFVSISVGNNDGNIDPANGIVLNNTGAGGLTVNGSGTTDGTGGVIQNTTSRGASFISASNITLKNMTFTNAGTTDLDADNSGLSTGDNLATNAAIHLVTVTTATLDNVDITGGAEQGINGNAVSNFSLLNSTVTNVGNAADEDNIHFFNMTGTSVITNTTLTHTAGGGDDNLNLQMQSGTLNLTISGGSAVGITGGVNQLGSGYLFGIRGTANATITFSNASSTNNFSGGIVADSFDTATMNLIVTNSTSSGNNDQLSVSAGDNSNVNLTVTGNTLSAPAAGDFLPISLTGSALDNGFVFDASISGNTITVGNGLASDGIVVNNAGGGAMNVAITNNTIDYSGNQRAILVQAGTDGNGTNNITITGNSVDIKLDGAGNAVAGFLVQNAITGPGNTSSMCADIGGAGALANTFTHSQNVGAIAGGDIRVRQRNDGTMRLPGYAGAANSMPTVVTYLNGRNNEVTSATATNDSTGFAGGAACTQPNLASITPATSTQRDQFARVSEPSKPAVNTEAGPIVSQSSKPVVARTFSHHAQIAKRSVSKQQVNAMQDKSPRRGISVRPRVTPLAGETVSHSIGTLPAGKTVHIQFQVTVNSPYEGGETVSNQGTVSGSNFSDVLTDDPAVGGANDPTTTPILQIPNVSVADAQANEPASGSTPMLFTISLSAPAGPSGASVQYATADQSPAEAVAGVDYTAVPLTTLNFAAGEQFKTVTVNILADGAGAEVDETFLLNLSNPTNATIADGQAVGTIKQGNAAGTFLISEIRTSGPGGAGDDFVEVYNNTDTPLTVAASDASAGFGLFKMGADCSAAPVLIGVIPNGTTIPARGHYLFVGSAYSLTNYGGSGAAAGNLTLSSDIESDANVGIFNTSSVASLSSVTRLDAVGFGSNTGGVCDLLREGTTLPPLSGSTLEHSYVRDECGKKGNPAIFGVCPSNFLPVDTNVNNDDFIFVDTTAQVTVAGQRLGAPGPQNLANPLLRNDTITTLLLDSNFGGPSVPNRVRNLVAPEAPNGTLSVRRRLVNNTGAPVTRLRFRVVDISVAAVTGSVADVRAITSTSVVVSGITDAATCTASAAGPPPCTVTVLGTTLEQPPTQAIGGGHNSSLSAGTITLPTPLAPGASINLQFLLGVHKTGSFKFFFNVEALP